MTNGGLSLTTIQNYRTYNLITGGQPSPHINQIDMNHREHGEHHTAITGAVACLGDADGETIEAVIKMLGITEQLTRQLVMGASQIFIDMLVEEKQGLERDEMKRRVKCVLQDANAILTHLMDDKPLDGLTSYGVNIHTHIDNITTACDFLDDECITWKL